MTFAVFTELDSDREVLTLFTTLACGLSMSHAAGAVASQTTQRSPLCHEFYLKTTIFKCCHYKHRVTQGS